MKVQDLLKNEDKWTTEEYSRAEDGLPTEPDYENATCWCILGAIKKCYNLKHDNEIGPKKVPNLNKLFEATECNDTEELFEWNDAPERTFTEVRKAIIKADV